MRKQTFRPTRPQLLSFEDFRRKPQRKPYQPSERSTNQKKIPATTTRRTVSSQQQQDPSEPKSVHPPRPNNLQSEIPCPRALSPHPLGPVIAGINKHPLTQNKRITLPRIAPQRRCSTQESTDRWSGGRRGEGKRSPYPASTSKFLASTLRKDPDPISQPPPSPSSSNSTELSLSPLPRWRRS